MNQSPEQLIANAKHAALTPDERLAMRARLTAFSLQYSPAPRPWAFLMRHVLASSLVVVGVMGVSTVALAQHALPGDFLYPVKANITEPAVAAFTFDEDDKISVELDQINGSLNDEDTLAGRDDALFADLQDLPTPGTGIRNSDDHRSNGEADISHQSGPQAGNHKNGDNKFIPSPRPSVSISPAASASATPLPRNIRHDDDERDNRGRDD